MKASLCIATLLAAAMLGAATDPPPPAPTEAPPEKPRLGGGFKGQPVTPGAKASPQKAAPQKAPPAPAGTRKPAARITIDNSMVKKNSAPAGDQKPAAGAPAAAAPAPAPPPPVDMPKVLDLNGHDEAFWRARAAQVRDAVRKATADAAAADAEEKREENDFYAWDDGQYRDNVIKPAWDKAREDAARARQDLAAAQKDLDMLEDDARRAGAYPGWIRE
jgi:hypothetical protein